LYFGQVEHNSGSNHASNFKIGQAWRVWACITSELRGKLLKKLRTGHHKEVCTLTYWALISPFLERTNLIHPKERLTLQMCAFESFYCGQFTLSTQLIKPILLLKCTTWGPIITKQMVKAVSTMVALYMYTSYFSLIT